jgi:hypothetical protein
LLLIEIMVLTLHVDHHQIGSSSHVDVRTHDIPVMHCASPVLPLLLVIYPAYFTYHP